MSRVCLCVLLALFTNVHCLSYSRELHQKLRDNQIDDASSLLRIRRYALAPNGGWKKRHLTYRFKNKPSKFSPDLAEKLFAAALAVWAAPAGLTFSKVEKGKADINVGFYKGKHNDKIPFDGPGYMLSHADFPKNDKPIKIHFDDDENWIGRDGDKDSGTSFFSVALYEIGHLLGLKSSNVAGAVMKDSFSHGGDELSSDDLSGIRALYPRS